MVIDIDEAQVRTVDQVRQVLAGTHELQFRAAPDDEGRYGWIEAVLRRLGYRQLERADRGAVLAYLQRFSGYSRPRRSNDNGLAETKNGAVVRKMFGYERTSRSATPGASTPSVPSTSTRS